MTGSKHLSPKKDSTQVIALRRKLLESQSYSKPKDGWNTPQPAVLEKIAEKTTMNIDDASNVLEMLPDIEQGMQILTCSILSPKDAVTIELTYSADPTDIPSELTSKMIEHVSNYFETSYKIKNILPDIIQDSLFLRGSYPMAILPESSIDDVINSNRTTSTESFNFVQSETEKSLGLLGPSDKQLADYRATHQKMSFESNYFLSSNVIEPDSTLIDFVEITDNPNVMKMPFLKTKVVSDRVHDAYSRITRMSSLESMNISDQQKKDIRKELETGQRFYVDRHYKQENIVPINNPLNASRVPIGHPLIMKLPAESVIPVHVPSNPSQHVGYFVLLDEFGNPLARARDSDYYGEMQNNAKQWSGGGFTAGQGSASALGNMTKNLQWGSCQADVYSMNELYRSWETITEKRVLERIVNGGLGDSVEVAKPADFYRIMLARALARKTTRVLFYPIEQLTYFAFDYNQYGVGRSLLDKTKILSSIRAMLLFANTMSAIKSSVSGLKATINIDEYDPNPDQTVELMQDQIVRATQMRWPNAQGGPQDILDYLSAASIVYEINGNDKYPDIKLDMAENKVERSRPDTELEETLAKRQMMGIGVSPEIADSTLEVEFAASVLSSNLLHAKKSMMYQDVLTAFIVEFIGKYVLSSGTLMAELILMIQDFQRNDKMTKPEDVMEVREIIAVFLSALRVKLPQPDNTKIAVQLEAYNTYKEACEAMLEDTIRPDLVSGMVGDKTDETVDVLIENMKAYMLRKWRQENGVMPELDIFTAKDEKGEPELNFMKEHMAHNANILASMGDFVSGIKETQNKIAQELAEAMAVETGEPVETYDGGSDTNTDDADAAPADDTGGGDDGFDLGTDLDTDLDTDDTIDADAAPADDTGGGDEDTPPEDDTTTA